MNTLRTLSAALALAAGVTWAPIKTYWNDASIENRNALREALTLEGTKWQYTHGVAPPAPSTDTMSLIETLHNH